MLDVAGVTNPVSCLAQVQLWFAPFFHGLGAQRCFKVWGNIQILKIQHFLTISPTFRLNFARYRSRVRWLKLDRWVALAILPISPTKLSAESSWDVRGFSLVCKVSHARCQRWCNFGSNNQHRLPGTPRSHFIPCWCSQTYAFKCFKHSLWNSEASLSVMMCSLSSITRIIFT